MARCNVVIIGAGPAGIAAATRLMTNGVNGIAILEAEGKIGGRIHTTEFADGVVDLGAQFVHGEKGNVVFEMAHPFNLLDSQYSLYSNMGFVDSNGTVLDKELSSWLLGLCLDITDRAGKELTKDANALGDFFITEYYKQVNSKNASVAVPSTMAHEFLDWFQRFQCSIDGSDSWFETSAAGHTEYWECEGDPVLIWRKAGYSKVFDLLTRKYPDPSKAIPIEKKLLFRKEVNRIEWNNMSDGGLVTVHCSDGTKLQAEHVIVTVSLGVLKEQAHRMFTPPLPAKKLNAIDGLSIGTVDKIFVKFSHSWWPKDSGGFSFVWTKEQALNFSRQYGHNERKSWLQDVFGFYTDRGQPGVLCGWIVGPSARIMERLSDVEVLDGCQELLDRFLGQAYKVPRIQTIVRSQWHINPHFRGSYSFRSMESERRGVKASDLAEPLVNSGHHEVVFFAGEATHDHYFSTVHGAIESGWREADRIIRTVRARKSNL